LSTTYKGGGAIPRVITVPLALVAFVCFYAAARPALVSHIQFWSSPKILCDDAREHIAPYLKFHGAGVFENDIISDYFVACHPVGYRALFTLGSKMWDPRSMSNILPYVLLAVLLAATGLAAYRLGGATAAWITVALSFFTTAFMPRMVGALPRGFGYPLVALVVVAFVYGRVWAMIFVIGLAVAFYPIIAVPAGLAFVFVMWLYPSRDRGDAAGWSWRRRIAAVAGATLLAVLIYLPTSLAVRPFGPVLKPADWQAYPEAGPKGRSRVTAGGPLLKSLSRDVSSAVGGALLKRGTSFSAGARRIMADHVLRERWRAWLVLALMATGVGWLRRSDPGAGRLLALLAASLLAYLLSRAVYPHLYEPERYTSYVISYFVLFAVPLSIAGWTRRLARPFPSLRGTPRGKLVEGIAVWGISGFVLMSACGPSFNVTGIAVRVQGQEGALAAWARALPKDALIAGWPKDMDSVPYAAERRVLVSRETQLCYHKAYVDIMRERMRCLIDAYFATNVTPLIRLRDEMGVTHLVVNLEHYTGHTPPYFKPYRSWVRKARAKVSSPDEYETLRQRRWAAAFTNGLSFVLDLSRVRVELGSPARSGPGP
jgi:hypothetical protein